MPFAHENQGRRLYHFIESTLSRIPRLTWKSWTRIGAAAFFILICFLAGSWYGQRQAVKSGPGARKAAAGLVGDIGKDIVCGKLVDERKAEAEGWISQYHGKTYVFCSEAWQQQFQQDPESYVGSWTIGTTTPPKVATDDSAAPEAPAAPPEPLVEAPPPYRKPSVIPPTAPMPPATPSPAAPSSTAGAPVIKHPPAGSGPPAGLEVPSVSDQPFAWQPPTGSGPTIPGSPNEGPGQEQPSARMDASHHEPFPVPPGSPSPAPAGAQGGRDQCHD